MVRQLIKNQLSLAFFHNPRQYPIVLIFLLSRPELMFFMLSVLIIGNLMSTDERCKIDPLYCSLPVTRAQIVKARYLSIYAIFLVSLAISFAVAALSNLSGLRDYDLLLVFQNMLLYVLGPVTIILAFVLPIHFKLGGEIEKNFKYTMAVVGAIVVLIAVSVFIIYTFTLEKEEFPHLPVFITTASLVFITASHGLSQLLFRNRDL